MEKINDVYKAIHRCGGVTLCAIYLKVNSQTLYKWINKGYVPKLEKAKLLAKASGFDVEALRPTFQPRPLALYR